MSAIYTIETLDTFRRICRWESAQTAAEYAASGRGIRTATDSHPAVRYALPHLRHARDERNVPLWLDGER